MGNSTSVIFIIFYIDDAYQEKDIVNNQSILSQSMRFDSRNPRQTNKTMNIIIKKEEDSFSMFESVLNKTDMSSIYNGSKKQDANFDSESVADSFFNQKTPSTFNKKIHSSSDLNRFQKNNLVLTPTGSTQLIPKIKSQPNDVETSFEDSSIVNTSIVSSKDTSSIASLVKQVAADVKGELKDKHIKDFIKESNNIKLFYLFFSE